MPTLLPGDLARVGVYATRRGSMAKIKTITTMSVLTALALIIFIVEAQIPALFAIPGIKLGLANVVTLIALKLLGRRQAGMILAARIILGSIFTGNFSVILYSGVGGILCYTVMSLSLCRITQLWVVSVLGALAHNAGQLLVASLILRSASVYLYLPPLIISAIITGAFTGLCAAYICKYQKWLKPPS